MPPMSLDFLNKQTKIVLFSLQLMARHEWLVLAGITAGQTWKKPFVVCDKRVFHDTPILLFERLPGRKIWPKMEVTELIAVLDF